MSFRRVIDTEIVADIFKGLSTAVFYEKVLLNCEVAIASQTFADLQLWMLQAKWSEERQAQFEAYLNRYVVVPPDNLICRIWAGAQYRNQHFGEPADPSVTWIGATAVALECPVVTRRPGQFGCHPSLAFVSDPKAAWTM